MADETFAEFMARERARLHGEREAVFTAQQELEGKLAEINRDFDVEGLWIRRPAPALRGRIADLLSRGIQA